MPINFLLHRRAVRAPNGSCASARGWPDGRRKNRQADVQKRIASFGFAKSMMRRFIGAAILAASWPSSLRAAAGAGEERRAVATPAARRRRAATARRPEQVRRHHQRRERRGGLRQTVRAVDGELAAARWSSVSASPKTDLKVLTESRGQRRGARDRRGGAARVRVVARRGEGREHGLRLLHRPRLVRRQAGEVQSGRPGPARGRVRELCSARCPARRVVVVNMASASGEFVKALAGRGRVVVTATRSGQEQNAPRFAEHFIAALDGARGGRRPERARLRPRSLRLRRAPRPPSTTSARAVSRPSTRCWKTAATASATRRRKAATARWRARPTSTR